MAHKPLLWGYSLAHALVDFSCCFLVYRTMLDEPHLSILLLLYNFCAFALQMPFGLLADDWNRNGLVAASGCGLIALAYIPFWPPIAAAILAGVGNGLFHVGGGLDVINNSHEHAWSLGIFVSPGALGLYLGGISGLGTVLNPWLPALSMICTCIILLMLSKQATGSLYSENAPFALPPRETYTSLALLTIVVILRSYVGFNQTLPWKSEGHWDTIATLALVLGKASGGFLCDWLGAKKATILSLGLSALCYLGAGNPILGTLAVFLFNMTMPVTLYAAAQRMPGTKGFAFGLLTFGLFLGYVPTCLGWPSVLSTNEAMSIAAILSGVLLLAGLRERKTHDR